MSIYLKDALSLYGPFLVIVHKSSRQEMWEARDRESWEKIYNGCLARLDGAGLKVGELLHRIEGEGERRENGGLSSGRG
jgi:hypothetical protein